MTEVPHALAERELLLSYLERQRSLIFAKVDGLAERDVRAITTGSGLTVRGIVYHLCDVERSWIRRWFAGQVGVRIDGVTAGHVADPLTVADHADLVGLVAAYREETVRCDAVIAAHDLEDTEADGSRTLRWIVLHLIEEISRHLGHLDLLCELADGRTGD